MSVLVTVSAFGPEGKVRVPSAGVEALALVDAWPAETVAVAVLDGDGAELGARGPRDRVLRWASVTKLLTALAVLVAAEEGTVDLDEPAGPPGSTVRHLLAHASGLPFHGAAPIARPETRRIYSNTGHRGARPSTWRSAPGCRSPSTCARPCWSRSG